MFGTAVAHKVRTGTKAFGGARGGNFSLALAGASAMIFLAAGYALNTAQLYNVKSHLNQALDAAVTSTARDLSTGIIKEKDARATVEAFLRANMGSGFADAGQVVLEAIEVDRAASTVSASASVDVAVAFPLFGSGNTQRVASETAAVYSDKKIEVAMMLDVTGSMQGQKIRDLKTAAANAVEQLLGGQKESEPRVRVALVPYAEAVNVGRLADDVVFRERGNRSDLPPHLEASRNEIRRNTAERVDGCATERKLPDGSADFSDDGPFTERLNEDDKIYLARVNRDDRLGSCPEAELVPLTADKDKLIDVIDDFEADGVTAGGIAVQWSYYMLSQQWSSAIRSAGLGDGPADADDRKVAKIAILMTDGQFNTAFAGRGSGQQAKSRNNAEALCGAMKDDGIEVFTIGFALDDRDVSREEREQARAVLQNCASDDTSTIKHFYEASTGEELDAAYKAIIANTERLYLSM